MEVGDIVCVNINGKFKQGVIKTKRKMYESGVYYYSGNITYESEPSGCLFIGFDSRQVFKIKQEKATNNQNIC